MPRRQQRAGEGEAKGDTACGRDGLGNGGAGSGLYTIGVAGEGPGGCDVLHAVRTKRKRLARNAKRWQIFFKRHDVIMNWPERIKNPTTR